MFRKKKEDIMLTPFPFEWLAGIISRNKKVAPTCTPKICDAVIVIYLVR